MDLYQSLNKGDRIMKQFPHSFSMCLKTVLAVGALWASVGVSTAHADDAKVYSGSMCRPESASNDSRFQILRDGTVTNTNPNTRGTYAVLCPIYRDVSVNKGGKIKHVTVWFLDNNPVQSFSCSVVARDASGNTRAQGRGRDRRRTGFGKMTIPGPRLGGHNYAMRCSLPHKVGERRSMLISYQVREKS